MPETFEDEAPIPFARPFIRQEEETAVLRVLRSGWLTTGGEALAFEKEFAAFLEHPEALKDTASMRSSPGLQASKMVTDTFAVNSATSGLHLALEACGIGPGDLALLPSCTFTSTAEVLRYLGADPVFVDSAPGCFNMDPIALEKTCRSLGKKAKAVLPVHFGGLPCDMKAILEIAKRYNLKVVEDAAHSFPSPLPSLEGSGENGPAWAGTLGDAGVFSFYATKTLTTGEGGMVVCKDETIAKRIALMRSHGIDRSVWNRYTDTKASWYYEVVEAGYKYNLPDILAALGRVQLSRAWDLLAMRQDIAARYDAAFKDDPHFILPPTGEGDARHLYPLRLDLSQITINRDSFIEKLQDRGIGVSVHFIPLHIMPFYKNRYKIKEDDFPESLKNFKQVISLPIWPGMTEKQVNRVIDSCKSIAGEQRR